MRGGLLAAWFASLGLTSWRTVHRQHRPPLPSEVVSTLVVFGGLSLISASDSAAPVATVFGWGVVVAQLLGFFPLAPGPVATGPITAINPGGVGPLLPPGSQPAPGGQRTTVPGVGSFITPPGFGQ